MNSEEIVRIGAILGLMAPIELALAGVVVQLTVETDPL
jgi:hypothetical protein